MRLAQDVACQPVSQRRLADAFRTGDQPAVMHAPGCKRFRQSAFDRLVPEEILRVPRMQKAFEAIGLWQHFHFLQCGGASHRSEFFRFSLDHAKLQLLPCRASYRKNRFTLFRKHSSLSCFLPEKPLHTFPEALLAQSKNTLGCGPNPRCNVLFATRAIDDDAAFRIGLRQVEKALAQRFVKGTVAAFEAIGIVAFSLGNAPRMSPRQSLADIHVDDEREVWPCIADHRKLQRIENAGGHLAGGTLIDPCRIGEVIADHPRARSKRRPDCNVEIVGACGRQKSASAKGPCAGVAGSSSSARTRSANGEPRAHG